MCVFDSTAGKSVFTYSNVSIGDDGYYVVLANAVQNVSDFVGITTEAIASGATGTVTVSGGVSTNQSSLTIGSTYYVQADGTISTVATSPAVLVGEAVSATSLLLNALARPSTPAGMTLLSTVTASSSSYVHLDTTFDATYDAYLIVATGVTFSNNEVNLRMRFRTGAGTNVTSGYYGHTTYITSSSETYAANMYSNAGYGEVARSTSNATKSSTNFRMRINDPANTAFSKLAGWEGEQIKSDSSHAMKVSGVIANDNQQAMTGLRFYASGGTLLAGKFRVYGLAK